MSFSLQCPHCKTVHEVAEQLIGKTVRCSACSNLLKVSDPGQAAGDGSASGAFRGDEQTTDSNQPPNPYSAKSDTELVSLAKPLKSKKSGKSKKSAWKGAPESADEPRAALAESVSDEPPDGGDGFQQFEMPRNKERMDEEMDMTPMVDVTFLLLIFFMVTASFTLQKSMDLPTKTQDEPSPNVVVDFEDNPEYVSVFVSPYNEYRVRTSEYDWEDAPNRHELRVRLTDALQAQSKPEKLLIMAHADCFHDKVIQAMDIGIELQYKIQVIMTEEEF